MAKSKSTTSSSSKSVKPAAKKSAPRTSAAKAPQATSAAKAPTKRSAKAADSGGTAIAAPSPTPQVVMAPSYEQIAKRAFEIWVRKGRPIGLDDQNWHEAEQELRSAQ